MTNKNRIVLAVVVVCLGIVAALAWLVYRPGLPVEQALPSGAAFYGRLAHVEEHINQMVNSDLFKNMAAIDLAKVLARNGIPEVIITQVKDLQKNIQTFWVNPITKRIFGKEIAVAVYQKPNGYAVLMAVRLDVPAQIAEFVGQLYHQWGKDAVLTRETYQGYKVNHIILKNNIKFAYVRFHDLLVASLEPSQYLRRAVEVRRGTRTALSRDPGFLSIQQRSYPSGDGLVFVNAASFLALVQEQWGSRRKGGDWQGSSALLTYGFSYLPGEVSKYRVVVGVDLRQMKPDARKVFACPPLANESLKFVAPDAIIYNWGTCYDFKESWQSLKEQLAASPEVMANARKFKHSVEKRLKVNIEQDVLPVLGNEVGGYLTDVDMQGMFPFPRMLLFVKVRDHALAEQLLDKFIENPVVSLNSEEYKQVNIRYFDLPLGANMDPGYAFVGDYLLAATSRQLLKKSIDAYHDPARSIASDKTVKQFGLAGSDKKNSVTFLKIGELAKRWEDVLSWMNKYLSSQVSRAAAYQEEGEIKNKELDEAIANQTNDLRLAQKKLNELKAKPLADVSQEDPSVTLEPIRHLQRETEGLRNDLATYKAQKEDLARTMAGYEAQAKSAKLAIFNTDNILLPLLKGLATVDAQGVTVRLSGNVLETEFLVK